MWLCKSEVRISICEQKLNEFAHEFFAEVATHGHSPQCVGRSQCLRQFIFLHHVCGETI